MAFNIRTESIKKRTVNTLIIGVITLFLFSANSSLAQIRFYAQYKGIPYFGKGGSDFKLLTGFKLDPNKELVVGLGLLGSFSPNEFEGDLRFKKSSLSLTYNYYHTRRLYFGLALSLDMIDKIITNNSFQEGSLADNYFLDYQFDITYVIFRRLHFSFSTGIIDFSNLVVDSTNDLVEYQKFEPNIDLALRLYLFQIKL